MNQKGPRSSQGRTERPAHSRLGVLPDDLLVSEAWAVNLSSELHAYDSHLMVDLAHVVMLTERKLVPREAAIGILRELLVLWRGGAESLDTDPQRGSLQLQVEHHLSEHLGHDVAGWLQLGRSRIDQGSAVARVALRAGLLNTLRALVELEEKVLFQARKHRSTLMPGYTHLQAAQPWVFGHYLLSQIDVILRDVARLVGALERVDLNPLGTAALTGSSWDLDRERTATLLGHPGVVRNARDAGVFSMEFTAEAAGVLALAASNLGRFAADLYIWSTSEFGLFEIDPAFCGISSIMPQKKNPNALERVKAVAAQAIGWMPTELGVLRLSTSTDCDVAFVRGGLNAAVADVAGAARLMGAVVETITANTDRMSEILSSSWLLGTELVDEIVRTRGVDFRTAHEIVATVIRRCVADRVVPAALTPEIIDDVAAELIGRPLNLSSLDLTRVLDPRAFPGTRVTDGSLHPDQIERLLTEAKVDIVKAKADLSFRTSRVADARRALESAVVSLIGSDSDNHIERMRVAK